MAENTKTVSLWWAVPAAVVLVVLTLAMLLGKPAEPRGNGTSYDASLRGFRAAYLLLDELGYPVVRSKRAPGSGDAVRWVLFPKNDLKEAGQLDEWVHRGGVLVLADDTTDLAGKLGLKLRIRLEKPNTVVETATGAGTAQIAGGATRVEGPGAASMVWAEAGARPLVTVYRRGQGEIWLVNRPEFLTNRLIGQADNGVLLCRLAEAVLQRRAGKLGFDEVVHGMRDRPGVMELLFEPPTLWVTLQGTFLLGLLLWHFMPRFGTLRPVARPRRRSKEEYLDALAALLERKADYAEAFHAAQGALRQEMERALGVPAGTPAEQLALEAARRWPIQREAAERLLGANRLPTGTGAAAFLKSLDDLESLREAFFNGRHDR